MENVHQHPDFFIKTVLLGKMSAERNSVLSDMVLLHSGAAPNLVADQ